MGNSTTAGRRSSARGRAHRYQRTQPPKKQHRPPRKVPPQSQRDSHSQQPSSPDRPPNLAKKHRRVSSHQSQSSQPSEVGAPPAKRRRVDASAPESKQQQPQQQPPGQQELLEDVSPVRPPAKLSVADPHGRFQRTANGIRTTLRINEDHTGSSELSTAQPDEDKRVLRSQDRGPRCASDLVQFFPDYEEHVFGDSKQRDILTIGSSLYVTEDKSKTQSLPIRTTAKPATDARAKSQPRQTAKDSDQGVALGTNSIDETPDLSAFDREALDFLKDPLLDSEFVKAHKRGERNEKQMRNVEKERAMHEKSELERLYEELRGADWLKAMGITGITETEKKQYEPKRDYYILKVKTLLNKFEKWKDKEKEMKSKRERAMTAKLDNETPEALLIDSQPQVKEEDLAENHAEGIGGRLREKRPRSGGMGRKGPSETRSTNIQQPAKGQDDHASSSNQNRETRKGKVSDSVPPPQKWESPRPLTSFYAKDHEREAAKSKHRRGGRHVTAFGQALPQVMQSEFDLPEDFLSTDEIRDHARKRRRDKRENLKNESS